MTIEQVAKERGHSKPYLVGGVPRDRVRGVAKEIDDLDLTTTDGDAKDLGYSVAVSGKLKHDYFQLYDDNHCAIRIGGLKIDFSSHFIIPDIDSVLKAMGITELNSLVRETYSRDFTINTLLEDLELKNTYDLTKHALVDIQNELIRCPIPADITIKNDPKRILRAVKFALRFDYKIDDELQATIKKYAYLLKEFSAEYLKDKANEIVELDKKRGIELLTELGILKHIPITKKIYDELIKQRKLYNIL